MWTHKSEKLFVHPILCTKIVKSVGNLGESIPTLVKKTKKASLFKGNQSISFIKTIRLN